MLRNIENVLRRKRQICFFFPSSGKLTIFLNASTVLPYDKSFGKYVQMAGNLKDLQKLNLSYYNNADNSSKFFLDTDGNNENNFSVQSLAERVVFILDKN